jgi:hypothetical protein
VPPGGIDAGVDGGSADAGDDAGQGDAGADAGVDAGSADAGDAGPIDAGIPDAGPVWLNMDIGVVRVPGSVTFDGGAMIVFAQSWEIWDDVDSFHYVYQAYSGDVEITARIVSLVNTHPFARAGLMLRQDLTPSSANAMSMITGQQGQSFQVRDAGGALTGPGVSDFMLTQRPPYWVRLTRKAGTLTAYAAPDDGGSFYAFGNLPDSLPSSLFVGVAVTSLNMDAGTTAVIDNLTIRVP